MTRPRERHVHRAGGDETRPCDVLREAGRCGLSGKSQERGRRAQEAPRRNPVFTLKATGTHRRF